MDKKEIELHKGRQRKYSLEMKRFLSLAFFSCLLIFSLFSSVTIVHISDLHYISPSLYDYERLKNLSYKGDGKATHIEDQILDAFIEEMLLLSPDAVMISGDLTYNGETESHKDLRAKLETLKDNGIKVFVIMVNHDAGRTSYALYEDKVVETPAMTAMAGEEHWLEYGYGEAIMQDPYSSSYLTEISDGLYLLALDSNNGSGGTVRQKTVTWMDSALKKAKADGAKVISMTHQNLFVHNPRYTFGYQINNASVVLKKLEAYGVSLNLSGHLHNQHISTDSRMVEIAAESFSDWPLQYGILEINDDFSYSYSTKEIDDESLKSEALRTFDLSTKSKVEGKLEGMEDETKEAMLDTALRLNREYFRGYVEDREDPGLDLWLLRPELSLTSYFSFIASDNGDYRKVEGNL